MSKRVHYCDDHNSYDIIRLYDGEDDKPFDKVYYAFKIEKKLVHEEWKPEFQQSLSLCQLFKCCRCHFKYCRSDKSVKSECL